MPAKSRRSKAKKYQQNKINQYAQRQNSVAAAAAPSVAPKAVTPAQAAPAGKISAAAAAVKADHYSYVPGDLRRIGILTGIIAVILLILYFILA